MRTIRRGIAAALLIAVAVWAPVGARAGSYEDSSTGKKVLYTAKAVAANTLPVAGSLVEPKCLPGYFFCKLTFAFGSLLFAGENLAMSGGADVDQSRAILYRGFSGDWWVTPRDIAGDRQPQILPTPPPPSGGSGGSGGFVPPPR